MIYELIAIIAPVFVCAAIGFGWSRLGRPYDAEFVTALVTNIGAPCLVFSTLSSVEIDVEAFGAMAGVAALTLAATAAAGIVVLRVAGLSMRTFLPSLMFPNVGNMGLPLCLLAFGETGLALAIAYFTVCSVGQMTLGAGMAAGATSVREVMRGSRHICGAVGVAVHDLERRSAGLAGQHHAASGRHPDSADANFARYFAGQAARQKPEAQLGPVAGTLVFGFAVGVGVAEAFGLEGIARGVVILQSTMPTAVFNYLFSLRYGREHEEVAGIVMISTTLSFATLPLLLWFVL